MAAGTAVKKDGYAKRNANSVPEPIELDSDPDFNPGIYIPPESEKKPKKRGRKRKAQAREDSDEDEYDAQPHKVWVKTVPLRENLLTKYFGDGGVSESEEEDEDESTEADDEVEDEDDEEFEHEHDEPVPLGRTWTILKQSEPKPPESNGTHQAVLADVSDTESESDYTPPPKKVVKGTSNETNPPSKTSFNEDDTESESDGPPPPRFSTNSAQYNDADTEDDTESESDYDSSSRANVIGKSKPNFSLAPGQQRLGPLALDTEKKIVVPSAINTYLREYQRDGVRFFWKMYSEDRGGLLGDDMGLGKTVQVISFLSAIMQKSGLAADKNRRHEHVQRLQDGEMWRKKRKLPPADETWPTALIVAPFSVVANWARELETWGYFEVGIYSGPDRKSVLKDFTMGRLDILLTTPNLVRKDVELLYDQAFTCIFIDEAHSLKNPSATLTKAVNRYLCPRRIGLTGTAIQNSYQEFHTILEWTNPGAVGTKKQWRRLVSGPLTLGQSSSSTEEERAQAAAVALVLRDEFLPNFFLRRTKDIIKDQLPKKLDNVVFCPLTSKQSKAYRQILKQPAVQNLISKDDPCPCGSKNSRKKCCHKYEPADMLRYMSVLLKLSNHLGLVLPGPNDSKEQTARAREIASILFPNGDAPSWGKSILDPGFCGKWQALQDLLKNWREEKQNNKVLLFTKSVKLLEMLDYQLQALALPFVRLDGSSKDRMPIIDRFNNNPNVFVFLISTMAGGTGLNLTAANKVVIFDPNWNPAHDLQAMDRAFRFGQTRNVDVYRLLGAGSLEELIYARQLYKQQQMAIGYEASAQTRYFKGIQDNNNQPGELFGLKNIFKLQEGELATKMAIERATLADFDWALANMSSRGKVREAADVETAEKTTKDDGVRGLGSFMFDDGPASSSTPSQDDVNKILSNIGVQYTHRNDDVLRPSVREQAERLKIETMRSQRKGKIRRSSSKKGEHSSQEQSKPSPKKKRKVASDSGAAKPIWPPIRTSRKPKEKPEDLIMARYEALFDLKYVQSQADLANVARQFAASPPDEQRKVLKLLDQRMEEIKQRKSDDDEDD